MYQTIDYFCDNQKNENGLFLLDMPTGLGKTYAVTEYLYKLAMDDVRAGQKVFFITTLKKNLPMEDLRNRFANDGQMARFEEKVLYIVSNADSVLGNWSDEVICAIPEGIKQTKEFRALEYDVQFIRCYDADPNPDAKSSVAKAKENLCQNSEYQFRQYVSKLICNQFPNVQARLQAVHTDPAWQWLGKLYPAVFTRERQIIFLSMEKFLVHNTTIIEPNYVLCQSDLIRDAVIFIDEFDATKETLLKSIINNGIRNSVDCLELFRDIHTALQASKNAYALAKPWQCSWYSGYAEGYFRSLIADLKQRADALHNTFCLSLNCGTCADGTSANKYYLFQDHGHYLFLDGGQNTATMSDGDPGMGLDRDTNNVYEILNQMQYTITMQRKHISVKEAAAQWGVTIQMVRRYCQKGMIPQVIQENGGWRIPEGTPRPGTQKPEAIEPKQSSLVNQIMYQQRNNNHFGIYEYIQVNLAYSSNRMASNRLTREQIKDLYRTKKLSVSFEPTKVDDIVEIMNHFICAREMVDTIMEPLSPSLIRRYHYCLTYGTYADQKHQIGNGEYRKNPSKLGVPAKAISSKLDELIQSYENKSIDMDAILDFHVRFEKIHPFEDYNGRVGRLIMMKECLRHNIVPFIVDDKRRGDYNKGIKCWSSDPSILKEAGLKAQDRFKRQVELQRLLRQNQHLAH